MEDTLSIINERAGKHFDPQCVESLKRALPTANGQRVFLFAFGAIVFVDCGQAAMLAVLEYLGRLHGSLRSDVGCLYFATLGLGDGHLQRLDIVPLQLKQFRLRTADAAARSYLEAIFNVGDCRVGALATTRMLPSWPLEWSAAA
jgi:hypothetical protein